MLYACITFFVIAVVFVGLTYSGKWQAGLIEVGCSAFLFVIFLHILKIITPQSSGKIVTVLSVIIVVMLIYANYSLQRDEHKEYTFKELLVGDLLVKKLIGTQEGLPDELLSKRLEDVIPGEFAQTKTEKDTIESPFEKPEKVLMGKPVTLPLDKPVTVSVRKEKLHPLGIPEETVNYKLKVANNEGLRVERARAVTAGFLVRLDKFNEQVSGLYASDSLCLPFEAKITNDSLSRTIYDKIELPTAIFEPEIQTALPEEGVVEEAGKQAEGKLQKP
ncbi:MAG: hypothetical protein MAG551_01292 [Candidatus Scalindua arabica]|uniref:Uncharacterized protein n=1 Tax=Candidatus Scalindua arabica TaxID=1127984 RepID=A0A942A410_9BACT|nr:hypothetical protein [Candidatus Scalindua arabica]